MLIDSRFLIFYLIHLCPRWVAWKGVCSTYWFEWFVGCNHLTCSGAVFYSTGFCNGSMLLCRKNPSALLSCLVYVENCLDSADLLSLTLHLGLHSHKFSDQQTIPGIDGFADATPVRGLQRMVSWMKPILFCIAGSMAVLHISYIAKVADTLFLPRSLTA